MGPRRAKSIFKLGGREMNKECTELFKVYANGEIEREYEGVNGVKEIYYHESQGEGDRHYCDVTYFSGKTKRVFNPDTVTFKKDWY